MKIRATLRIRNEAMLAARERFHLSQKHLAELADVPLNLVTQMECLDLQVDLQVPRIGIQK